MIDWPVPPGTETPISAAGDDTVQAGLHDVLDSIADWNIKVSETEPL